MVPEKNLNFKNIIILTGVTASGKTSISLDWARKNPTLEIINADSLLVYQGFNIGTAKPTPEEQKQVPHHLIDICSPDEWFTAGDFLKMTFMKIKEIEERGHRALIVGGSGFYLKALLYGLWETPPSHPEIKKKLESHENEILYEELLKKDPSHALKVGRNDRYRLIRSLEIIRSSHLLPSDLEAQKTSQEKLPFFHLFFLDRPNQELFDRVSKRSEHMVHSGLIDEVKFLYTQYPQSRALQSVGYKETIRHLKGHSPSGRKIKDGLTGLIEEISLATRQLIKRQRTWVRGQFLNQKNDATLFTLDTDLHLLNQRFNEIYSIH